MNVEALYPYDGPHTPDTVREAAEDLSGLVRYLANATRRGDSLPQPGDLAAVVGSLQQVAGGLPQVLNQLAAHADRYATRADLSDSRSGDPAVVARDLSQYLRTAADGIAAIRAVLASAHEAASRLGVNPEGETR